MSKIFDSHCHPNFPQYDGDREEMITRAFGAGVSMICVGVNLETSKSGIELAQKHEGVWATVGAHPTDAVSSNEKIVSSDYEKLLKNSKVIAVGEVGLDHYRTPEIEKQEIQKKVFKEFIELALKHNLPLVLHSRDASKGSKGKVHADMIEILSTYYSLLPANFPRGVAHSFTGSLEEAQKYLGLGFYLGFNGIITFARQYDEMIRSVPLNRILIETDAPYLTPEPYRGQRNEPSYVIEVAKKLAELKDVSFEEICTQTTQNCKKLFKLDI